MEIKNSKKQDEIANLNEEELIIYTYLNGGENKLKTKTDLENKISELTKLKDSIPKIEENDQNLTNNLIKEYFEEKENKNKINLPNENKPNIIYSIDNLLNEKEKIEKKIKDKKEAVDLLKELNNLIKANNISQNLIKKINDNSVLCRNQELKNYLSQIIKNKNKYHEKEDLTEEQKIIVSFRNLLKNSLKEAKSDIIEQTTIMNLYQDLKFENIDIQKIINENEGNIGNDNLCKDKKIIEFKNTINITPSFYIFIKELHKYNPYMKNDKNNINIFYKIINLLISRYSSYFSNLNQNNEKISSFILIHNNLEMLTYLINYYILFYNYNNNEYNNNEKDIETINNSLMNIVIKIKNLSISILSQVIADFNDNLIKEMDQIESFENIYTNKIFDFCLKKVQETINKIFSFFDKLLATAIHREIILYFDNVLTLYFDLFNQKILNVNSYDLSDIQGLLKLSKEIINNYNSNHF